MEYWEEKIELAKAIRYHLFAGEKLKPCMWCGVHIEQDVATIEHILPASEGGPLSINNAGIACSSCNQKRGTKTREEFLSSSWLLEKKRQVHSQRSNRKIPKHQDGAEMSDQEIRLSSFMYLNSLTKDELLNITIGIAKQGHLDNWAAKFIEL